jgi:hypothetical protein
LKNGYPVDYIVFNDTLLEFSMMDGYKKKVIKYFKERYNKEIIVTKPITTFEDWCFGIMERGDLKGYIRGIPMVWLEPCYWRREAKIKPTEKLLKHIGTFKTYIGFTLDEADRRTKDKNTIYPLIDDFKMTERNCQEYLINQEMQNPLYNYFSRSGCGICSGQSQNAWYQVYTNFKEIWEYMKDIEFRLSKIEKVKNRTFFPGFRSCIDMEKLFKQKDKQGSLFDFSDEPLKDCFCKI